MLGEREVNIRDADEAKVEENLVKIGDRSFVTTVEDRDTTREISQIRHVCYVDNVLSLTTQMNIVRYF